MSEAATNFTKGDFTPVEEGDYLLRMNRVELAPCNNGKMVKASFQVVNGDYKNRLIFENFLVEHTSEKAEKIGKERLSKYLQAVGVEGGLEGIGHDFTQLSGYTELPFIGTVKIEPESTYTAKDGSERTAKARNGIKSFKKR
jgi:hypothetical protein